MVQVRRCHYWLAMQCTVGDVFTEAEHMGHRKNIFVRKIFVTPISFEATEIVEFYQKSKLNLMCEW